MRKRIATCCLAAVVSTTAGAADRWQKFASDDTATWYVDLETAGDAAEAGMRKIWLLRDLPSPDKTPWGSAQSVMFLQLVDCKLSRMTVQSYISYSGPMGTGKALASRNPADSWHDIAPGTAIEPLARAVCGK